MKQYDIKKLAAFKWVVLRDGNRVFGPATKGECESFVELMARVAQ